MAAVLPLFDEAELINLALVGCSGGACLRGHLKTSARAVALKLLSPDSCLSQMRDVLVQNGVCVDQVLQPVGVYRGRFLSALLWDWMPEGSLHSLLYETHLYPDLPLTLRLSILLEVAEGLNVLHSVSLPHTALKTTNVLLDHQYHAKLCDWGGETLRDGRMRVSNTGAVCIRDWIYLAPEVVQGQVACLHADMYSFGVLMWETLNRPPPGSDSHWIQLQNLVACAQKGVPPATERNLFPPETPQISILSQLMTRCWSVDVKLRPLAKDCVLELRKVLEGLNSGTDNRAVHLIKARKERVLLSCKYTQVLELPVELNNLEGFSSCTGPKHLKSKSVSVMVPPTHTHKALIRKRDETYLRGSPPSAGMARASPPAGCRGDAARRCAEVWDRKSSRLSPPAGTLCGSSLALTHTPLHPANQPVCPVYSGRTCCQLLQERREVIVRFMTEGRLNNLLDVLRARRAVTHEHYEFIMGAMTLSARTRCLLDTCACLGENVALLVATTLGLVSTEMTQGHTHSRISPLEKVIA